MKTMTVNAAAYQLAVKLDRFAEEHDTYDYYDVNDQGDMVENIAQALITNNRNRIDGIKDYLRGIIEDECWDADKAQDLLKELEEFERLTE